MGKISHQCLVLVYTVGVLPESRISYSGRRRLIGLLFARSAIGRVLKTVARRTYCFFNRMHILCADSPLARTYVYINSGWLMGKEKKKIVTLYF